MNGKHPNPSTASPPGMPSLASIPDHSGWMDVALTLARSMRGRVWPNPPVGCVIVRDGLQVGRGCTQIGGRPHAERVALDDAGERARGATLYVTLEPCSHWGKTPPCADAIIAAGVKTVHAAIQDPDPRVNGRGFQKLRESGVTVEVGQGAAEAQDIMAGFFHRISTGRPLLSIDAWALREDVVPEGFDGLLRGIYDDIELLTGDCERAVSVSRFGPGADPADVLQRLGEAGLTRLAMLESDFLAARFSPFANPQKIPCDEVSHAAEF